MVGEIRDGETAEIAIRAALTGHQVFSTLHTNDAAGAVTRLIDMGVEAFLISSSLVGVLAQRLVRRLCPKCRAEWSLTPALRERLAAFGEQDSAGPFYRAVGCEDCRGTGYRGRLGIFELLPITAELRELILQRRSSGQIKSAAQATILTMQKDAIQKALAGVTSVEEILRVCSGD
jgi:general secretion pathway protein E